MIFRSERRDSAIGRPVLAWIGLMLMAVSFIWLQLLPPRAVSHRSAFTPPTAGPFRVVVIDPGHGGKDSGTMKGGISEKDLTLDIARRAERLLQTRGMTTLMTRADDSYVPLPGRAALANEQHDCIFISIHFDDAARSVATGIETYYAAHQISKLHRALSWLPFLQSTALDSSNAESERLAAIMQESLVARTQALNRGTRPEQFFVIANVHHPAVLIEGGFLTNRDDVSKLATEDYRQQIAAAISDGVMRYREVLQQQQTALAVSSSGR
ncbi:MAG: N-acetylmuramoyl-L-alanine amidase [Verrucomicrobiota bacterium]